MYRQHSHSPNPYSQPQNNQGQGPPASPIDGVFNFTGFKPRFQSSPRYHQQFVHPKHSPQSQNPGHSPRYNPQASPRGQQDHSGYRSPFQSPPHNSFEGSGHNHSSNDRSFNRQNLWSNKKQSHNHRSEQDCNPGSSTDIRQYYNPSMLHDPWANLQPVPVQNNSLEAAK